MKKSRSDRLKLIADLATVKSQQSRKAVSYMQRKLADEKIKLEQLENCREDYEFSAGDGIARSASEFKNKARFSSKVDEALTQQQQQISAVDRQLQSVEQNWKQLYNRSKSLQKSCEQALATELASEDKREQKELEDNYRY